MSAADLGAAPLAPAPPGGDDTATEARPDNPLPPAPCGHPSTWFDRTLCPEPCGGMHTLCRICGEKMDGCPNGRPPARPGGDDGAVAGEVERLRRSQLSKAWAERDASLAEAARARAEVERLTRAHEVLAESARLAAALGRVEGLLDDPDDPYAHTADCIAARLGHGDPDCGACWTADLRTALAAAGTDETGDNR